MISRNKIQFELTAPPSSILAFSTDCLPSLIRILRDDWLLPAKEKDNTGTTSTSILHEIQESSISNFSLQH